MRAFLIGVFGGAGALHFLTPRPFDEIVPPPLPGPARWYTWASGVAELAVAAMLAREGTRRAGSRAAIALLAAVWPANVQMALDWGRSDRPAWQKAGAWARVPLQLPLMAAARRAGGERG